MRVGEGSFAYEFKYRNKLQFRTQSSIEVAVSLSHYALLLT